MGRLYDIIQTYIDHQRYPPSVRQLAVELGVSPTTVRNWRNPKDLPKAEHLEAVARVTGRTVDEVFLAAAYDAGYLAQPVEPPPEPERAAAESA